MAHTEQQKAGFKKEFAVRRKRQIILAVPLAAMVMAFAFLGEDGDNRTVMGFQASAVAPVLIVLVVGALVFSLKNWRCPACDKYLGKGMSPSFCPKCGVALQ
jgi:hypothetical protein